MDSERLFQITKERIDKVKEKQVKDLFEKFNRTENREELIRISRDAFPLEKEYVPKWNKSKENNADVLIATVGLRKEPIILSILILGVHEVHLLHTQGSKKMAMEVIDDLDLKRQKIVFNLHEVDEVNTVIIYEKVMKIIQGIGDKKVIIDPTSGRKAMGAGAASIAFYYDIPMRYLHGFEKKGIILPFSEHMKEIPNPYSVFGHVEINSILNLMNASHYSAAIKRCAEVKGRIKNVDRRKFINQLKQISQVYLDWDSFLHSKPDHKPGLASNLKEILEDYKEEIRFLNETTILQMRENLKFLEKIEEHWEPNNTNMADEYRIIDLFQNAERLAGREFYTDALARLHRLLELITFKLVQDMLLREDVTLTNKGEITIDNIKEYNEKSENPESKINLNDIRDKKLGIFSLMKILRTYGEYKELAERYLDSTYNDIRENRNKSLAGHGTTPVEEFQYKAYQRYIKEWLKKMFRREKRLNQLLRQSVFPEFKLNEKKH